MKKPIKMASGGTPAPRASMTDRAVRKELIKGTSDALERRKNYRPRDAFDDRMNGIEQATLKDRLNEDNRRYAAGMAKGGIAKKPKKKK